MEFDSKHGILFLSHASPASMFFGAMSHLSACDAQWVGASQLLRCFCLTFSACERALVPVQQRYTVGNQICLLNMHSLDHMPCQGALAFFAKWDVGCVPPPSNQHLCAARPEPVQQVLIWGKVDAFQGLVYTTLCIYAWDGQSHCETIRARGFRKDWKCEHATMSIDTHL